MYTFTVFTPTFNRAHTLSRVYTSLVRQTFRDFEWLVLDDGSTDNTAEQVGKWISEAPFRIRYIKQENAGKAAAINRGVGEATGTAFLILDSDDACVPTALERFKFHWDSIPAAEKMNFSGVTCLVSDPRGRVVGTPFPADFLDSDPLEIRAWNIKGEKWGFQRTDIMRRFPFPEIAGERFVPQSLVWNRIGCEYRTRFVNEALRVYYPTPGGLSSPLVRVRNPNSARYYYREFISNGYRASRRILFRNYANYSRYSLHAGIGIRAQADDVPRVPLWLATFPLALILFLLDRAKLRRNS